jgi:hypothetical protein
LDCNTTLCYVKLSPNKGRIINNKLPENLRVLDWIFLGLIAGCTFPIPGMISFWLNIEMK